MAKLESNNFRLDSIFVNVCLYAAARAHWLMEECGEMLFKTMLAANRTSLFIDTNTQSRHTILSLHLLFILFADLFVR